MIRVQNRLRIRLRCCLLVLAVVASIAPGAVTISFLGRPTGFSSSRGNGISGDGAVVIGDGNTPSGIRAIRWSAKEGWTNLGVLPGRTSSRAWGTDTIGDVVVGNCSAIGQPDRAFRWTTGGGMQDLGVLPGQLSSNARAVSADGSVVIGSSGFRTFRWTAASGMQDIGLPAGATSARPYGVSADGAVVVGTTTMSGQQRGFRWNLNDGFEILQPAPGFTTSDAYGISPDASYIVGESGGTNSSHATRWTADGVLDIGIVQNGSMSALHDVSDGVRTMVGGDRAPYPIAAMWTPSTGFINLNYYLATRGVSLGGVRLDVATGVSHDGSRIVGTTMDLGVSAWVVSGVPAPSGCLSFLACGWLLAARRSRPMMSAYTRA